MYEGLDVNAPFVPSEVQTYNPLYAKKNEIFRDKYVTTIVTDTLGGTLRRQTISNHSNVAENDV